MFSSQLFVAAVSILSIDSVLGVPPFNFLDKFSEFQFREPTASSASDFDPEFYESQRKIFRLPDYTIPESYQLKLIPNLNGDFIFTGDVSIKTFITQDTNIILLHSYNLDILSLQVTQGMKKIPSKYVLVPHTQMLNISTQTEIPAYSSIDLAIKFKGKLNDDMIGFYRSKYEIDGKIKWLATTQFEPTYARMVFPCFDEPRFRATFDVAVVRYENQRVLSNMPLMDTSWPIDSLNGRVMDVFQRTPPMPTYLLAIIVSEFHFVSDFQEIHQVYARENAIKDGEYAISESWDLVEVMTNVTLTQYTLPKLHFVAVPDFSAGAMENWGLTTYRERYILCGNRTCSTRNEEGVTTVMGHEIAHQWFGDYVTIQWWDYLWLNEGFATFFEYFLMHGKRPNWRLDEKFVVQATHYALSIDGIHVHRAMNAKVNTPQEILQTFDGISYQKGAAIIRMIYNHFEFDNFRLAMKLYLFERNENGGVAEPENLFNAFELVRLFNEIDMPRGLNMLTMMSQYTDQVGYPVLTVTRRKVTDEVDDIKIKQEPYRSPRSAKRIPDQVWTIPFACTKQSELDGFDDPRPTLWSYNKDEIILQAEVMADEWFICNIQQTAYCRVNYDTQGWKLITDVLHVNPWEIHSINRAQILDDSFTFALDEIIPFSIPLKALSYLQYDKDPIPWYTGIQKLYYLTTQYEATSAATSLKHFAKKIISPFYNSVGFDPTSTNDQPTKSLWGTITTVSCELQISNCISKAKEWYYRSNDLSSILPDVKETVLCTAIYTNSTMANWKRLWQLFTKSDVAAEKETVLMAAGCTKSTQQHKKFLFKLIDEENSEIRAQNEMYVYRSVLRHYRGVMSALKFIKDLLPELRKFKKSRRVVHRLLAGIRSTIKCKKQESLVDGLIIDAEKLNQKEFGDITAALKATKEAAQKNIRNNERRASELSNALKLLS